MSSSRRWYLILGLLLVGAVVFVALFPEWVTKVSPYYTDARTTVLDGKAPFPPGGAHPLGTDPFGRDVWSRVAYGAQTSLLFAVLIMGGRLLLGIPLGMLATYGPRFFNWLVERMYVFSSAIPPLLIYLMVLSTGTIRALSVKPSIMITVILTTLIEWPRIAVFIKGRMSELSSEQFVEGAVATGAKQTHIFWYHLMPHLWPNLLQVIAAEMGRALLTVAQLGIFGIWIGGGVMELIPYPESFAGPNYINTTGIPEWGTLLADARKLIRTSPWIPMAPATAFLISVIGFNLLSQGLEGVTFALGRWKAATTGRLSKWWRLAILPVAVIAAIPINNSLVRDYSAGVADIARRQSDALTRGDVGAYLATFDPSEPDYRTEISRWVEPTIKQGHQVAVARAQDFRSDGRDALANWVVSFGFPEKPPITVVRSIRLVKRDGTWYQARGGLTKLRGYYVDTYSDFDPTDNSISAADKRFDVRRVSTAADRAYRLVADYFPEVRGAPRPKVFFYPTHQTYLVAVDPTAASEEAAGIVRYSPGEAIRVSPLSLTKVDYWEFERRFAFELTKALAETRLGTTTAPPVALGLYDRATGTNDGKKDYWVNFFSLEVAPLRDFSALFDMKLTELNPVNQPGFLTQAAVMVDFLQKRGMSKEALVQHGASPASIAAALGTDVQSLGDQYNAFIRKELADRSILLRAEWRAEIPIPLTDAMAARATAAARGDASAFLAHADDSVRAAQSTWLDSAAKAGLKSYEATLLDARAKDGKATVHVLEHFQLAGRTQTQVVVQEWAEVQKGRWAMTSAPASIEANGR